MSTLFSCLKGVECVVPVLPRGCREYRPVLRRDVERDPWSLQIPLSLWSRTVAKDFKEKSIKVVGVCVNVRRKKVLTNTSFTLVCHYLPEKVKDDCTDSSVSGKITYR